MLANKSYTILHTHVALCVPGFEVKKDLRKTHFSWKFLLLKNNNHNIYWDRIGKLNDIEWISWFYFHWCSKTLNAACQLLLRLLQEHHRLSQHLNTCSLLSPFSLHRNSRLFLLAKIHSPLDKKQVLLSTVPPLWISGFGTIISSANNPVLLFLLCFTQDSSFLKILGIFSTITS